MARLSTAMRRAFTLIELLVVIAIIAILAAILFPVFAQAKRAAKNAVMMGNFRQIATAERLYALDYDGLFPSDEVLGGTYIRAVDDPYSLPTLLTPYAKSKAIWWSPNGKPNLQPYGVSICWSSASAVVGSDVDLAESGTSSLIIGWEAFNVLTPASGINLTTFKPTSSPKVESDKTKRVCNALGGKGVYWLYADSHVKGLVNSGCPAK